MTQTARMPVAFIGHGSPMVALEDNDVSRSWAALGAAMPRPKAILCISAHWETPVTAVTAMAQPRTIHDFGASFPRALFEQQYPAAGDPALAQRVAALLAPTPVALDETQWGLDHGAWSVLTHVFPLADIPVVQLGLDVNLTTAERFDIGRRLAPLRDEGVLILASGNIVHNLPAMNWSDPACPPYDWAKRFNDEIRDAILKDEPQRVLHADRLGPDAAKAAPNPEHFWPLIYILGARGPNDEVRLFNDRIEHGSLGMTSVFIEDRSEAARTAA